MDALTRGTDAPKLSVRDCCKRFTGRAHSAFLAVQGMMDTTKISRGSAPIFWAK